MVIVSKYLIAAIPALSTLIYLLYMIYKIKHLLGSLQYRNKNKRDYFYILCYGLIFVVNIVVHYKYFEIIDQSSWSNVSILRLATACWVSIYCIYIATITFLEGSIRRNGVFINQNIVLWKDVYYFNHMYNGKVELYIKVNNCFLKNKEKKISLKVSDEIISFLRTKLDLEEDS